MRFDDTLETVLAGDLTTPYGRHSAWRQLVDLIGRRRVPPDSRALTVLNAIRNEVPANIRAASARGLEYAEPPFALVSIFCVDEISVAAPVLRAARLSSSEWISLLPEMSSAARSVLRNRRDLGPPVKRALEAFGPADFVLADGTPAAAAPAQPEPDLAEPMFETGENDTLLDEDAVANAPEPSVSQPVMDPAPYPDILQAQPEAGVADPWPEEDVIALRSLTPLTESAKPLASPEAEDAAEGVTDSPPAEQQAEAEAEAPEPAPIADSTVATVAPDTEAVAAEAAAEPAESEFIEHVPPVRDAYPTSDMHFDPLPAPSAIAPPVYPEDAGLPAPATLVEAAVAADLSPAAAEEDLSFVALAGFATSLAVPEREAAAFDKPQSPDREDGPAHQSGTMATPVLSEPVAEQAAEAEDVAMSEDLLVEERVVEAAPADSAPDAEAGEGPFQISEVVARIDAFWRRQQDEVREPRPVPRPTGFRFETDAKGVIRWVDGVSRAPLVGLSLDQQGIPGAARIDAIAAGAFRRRAGFANSRLVIDGDSDAAGDWLISAIPVFDSSSGRFSGYRGTARRPRPDERAEPAVPPSSPADSLRQLVHELRTPTNAIAGFAEMIETQILGPVAEPYRDRAGVVRTQAKELLGAIDDLDLAARIESQALSLAPGKVALRPLLAGIADDLSQLAELRGACIALPIDDLAVTGDRRAVERLFARLMATLVSASGEGERVGVRSSVDGDDVLVTFERPAALADYQGESVLGIDDEGSDAALLGTGFALRLARNLARELGGSLVIEADNLTLRLPAADNEAMGQAHLS
ncbi:sensor histidine kinase [Sphingosinithalassobacter portus]|uniref:sensor histidine kinase n=1 Tax=Stakelama portus TaxID=2676234 RepID=UPI000D6E4A81|nr:HAMP domain-containing sensor histidine kinase [Sphingosinithalassobacter portus]